MLSMSQLVKASPRPDTLPKTSTGTTISQEIMGFNLKQSSGDGVVQEVEVVGRPSNIIWRMTNRSQWWQYYSLMDWYRGEVSLVDTLIMRSVTELFRYGIDWEPDFAVKCVDCGTTYENNVKICPYCNSKRLVKPEEKQKDYFVRPDGTSFIDEANENQQSLKDLCRMYAESEYQNNQAYMVAITGDVVDNETKQLIHSYPLEFICVDPKFVRMLYDEHAEPGELYAFTMDDRKCVIPLPRDGQLHATTEDGRILYPAYWQIGDSYGASGDSWFYTKDEVYQNHWFKQSMTYGVPHWLSIEDDLLTYHYLEKHTLKKYMYGYVRKVIVLPGFDEKVIRKVAKGVQDVLAKNDNSIPIVGLPPTPPGVTPQPATTLEMGTESGSDAISAKNEIRDRVCAHVGVPNLFAGDVEASGGMNNESQQITTFDRYLMDKYDYADSLLDWILSWFPKITDWKLRVSRPSKADQANKKLLEEIQVAQGMTSLGLVATYTNGEFVYSENPQNPPQQQQMGGRPNAMMDTQSGFRGMPGPGGLGGDQEQMDTDQEVGETMDEGQSQYMASVDAKLRKSDNSFRISQGDLRRAISEIRGKGRLRVSETE